MRIGIVGNGLIGKLLALAFHDEGNDVAIFDRDTELGHGSCAHAGAGMLAPYSELEFADPLVFHLGIDSVARWTEILSSLEQRVFIQSIGTIAIAHPVDVSLLHQFHHRVKTKLSKLGVPDLPQALDRDALTRLEPSIGERFDGGILLQGEGQIDNRQLLLALSFAIHVRGIELNFNTEVSSALPGRITFQSMKSREFDLTIDCRGLGASRDIAHLRGVRGEIIDVFAPEVKITRPIRFMHPRYPLYVVPRENHRFLIGATQIESDDLRPISVESALELLSAAFSLDSSFANASIMETRVNCRPALPDNLPSIHYQPGLLRVNGLYRHGFLVAPKVASLVMEFLTAGSIDLSFQQLFKEEAVAYANYG